MGMPTSDPKSPAVILVPPPALTAEPAVAAAGARAAPARVRENGGPAGPEPTRYGDWEKNGRCIDF